MGREVIHEKSPNKLEMHSRLWSHDDVIDVLERKIVRTSSQLYYYLFSNKKQ